MDFSDPFRRLLNLQNNSPSIRLAAAPKPQPLNVVTAKTPEISIQQPGSTYRPAKQPTLNSNPMTSVFEAPKAVPVGGMDKERNRRNVIDQVSQGKFVPFHEPNFVDKNPGGQLTKQEYDAAVQEGLKKKVQSDAGGTPLERAIKTEIGAAGKTAADTLGFAGKLARVPLDVVQAFLQAPIRIGNRVAEAITGEPSETNIDNKILSTIIGADKIGSTKEYGKEAVEGVGGILGQDFSNVPGWVQDVTGAGLTALDLTPLGASKASVRETIFGARKSTVSELAKEANVPEDEVMALAKKQAAGETLSTTEKALSQRLDSIAAKPNTEKQADLPKEDLDAIREAGGDVPEPQVLPGLPQSDIEAIKEAGGQVPQPTEANLPLPDLPESDIAAIQEAGGQIPAPSRTQDLAEEIAQVEQPEIPDVVNPADVEPAAAPEVQAIEDVAKAQTGTGGQVEVSQGDLPSTIDEANINAAPESAAVESSSPMPQKAEDIVPNADDETKQAVQKVLDSLNEAETAYNDVSKIRSAEKGQRISQARSQFEQAGGGEEGFKAKLGALKGKYSESSFNPVSASEETQKTILNDIEGSGLRDFEKLNTQNAIRKVWGSNTDKPTPSDINYIRKYFGDDLADAIKTAVKEEPETWRDKVAKIAGTPRAMMATGDLSFGGRQGAPLGARFPKEWATANKESVKYAVNQEYFDRAMKEITSDDAYELIADKMKVAMPAADNKGMEEGFAAADYAEKVPGFGKVVQGSDRAYAGGLTKLRFEAAKSVVDAAGGPDEMLKVYNSVYGDKADEAFKAMGEVINTFSGRGGKPGGILDQHMKTLSTTLFAPRLWAAKLNSLNPQFYYRIAKSNPEAAKMAIRTQATFLSMAGAVLSLAAAAGASVSWDPRSSDFAKIKVGNTRYDILGGLQQNIVLAARMITGEKINSETGELDTLGDGFTSPTRKDLLIQTIENKENPLLAYATKLLEGKDASGEEVNPFLEGAKLLIPLGIQGVADTTNDTGNVFTAAAINAPSFVGIGTQTYGSIATKDRGADSEGKLTFKGEIKPNMVTDKNGQVMLDAKGKPITVKYDPDATETQIRALKDEARRKASRSEFTRQQSKEDQSLMKLSESELKDYVKNGTIDQDKFDAIQRLQKGAETYGGNVDVPDSVRSDQAKAFYKKFNSMTDKDQKAWLAEKPDDNAKSVASMLNKQKSKGLSDFKPSNELAKRYAEYERDILDHPEYTDIDKRNRAKDFQKDAYQLNYSTDQRDIYSEGGSVDTKTLLDSGDIKKSDLDAAIKMDDELYNSGLTSSLKFSKKFRSEYGYGVPGSEGGSGGSSKEVSPHLAGFLPSASSAKASPAPQFSRKRRTKRFTFKDVNVPKGKAAKKITLNT